jgi:hypothetical protein
MTAVAPTTNTLRKASSPQGAFEIRIARQDIEKPLEDAIQVSLR